MFTMNLYDVMTAVIFTLGSLVIPADHPIGTLNGADNEATCTASGFFKTQRLLTSILLNGALVTYYFLVTVKTAPEIRLRKLRKWYSRRMWVDSGLRSDTVRQPDTLWVWRGPSSEQPATF